MQQAAHALLVLLLEVPILFGLGYLISLALVALHRLAFAHRNGNGRWAHLFMHALVLNGAMTLQWMLLLVLLPLLSMTKTAFDEGAADSHAVEDPSFAISVLQAFVFAWLLLLAFGIIAILNGLLRMALDLAFTIIVKRFSRTRS